MRQWPLRRLSRCSRVRRLMKIRAQLWTVGCGIPVCQLSTEPHFGAVQGHVWDAGCLEVAAILSNEGTS